MDYRIDSKLWAFDDPRVERLHAGKMTLEEFGRAARPTDPWSCVIRGDQAGLRVMEVVAYDEVGLTELRARHDRSLREMYSRTGGLDGIKIYENGELFCQVYPELRTAYEEIRRQVDLEKCRGCAIRAKSRLLLQLALEAPVKPDRPYGLLEKALPALALRRLREGRPLPLEEMTVPPDRALRRAMLPLRKRSLDPAKAVIVMPKSSPDKMLAAIRRGPADPGRKPPSSAGPRPACLDCARKHVAQAVVLLGESKLGYPYHRWLAIGHLAEASEEILAAHEILAAELREERLRIAIDADYTPDLMRFYPLFDEAEKEEQPKEAGA